MSQSNLCQEIELFNTVILPPTISYYDMAFLWDAQINNNVIITTEKLPSTGRSFELKNVDVRHSQQENIGIKEFHITTNPTDYDMNIAKLLGCCEVRIVEITNQSNESIINTALMYNRVTISYSLFPIF